RDKPLRIAHIDTEETWRGGQRQVFWLIKGLNRKGHNNVAIVKKGSALALKLKEAGENVFEVNACGEFDIFAARKLSGALRKESIDIVHAHSAHGVALA